MQVQAFGKMLALHVFFSCTFALQNQMGDNTTGEYISKSLLCFEWANKIEPGLADLCSLQQHHAVSLQKEHNIH